MRAVYHVGLSDVPASELAVLAWGLLRRPDSLVTQELQPGWAWNDPLFAIVASALGVDPPKEKPHTQSRREHEAMPAEDVKRLLEMPRSAER